jgi:hypothetical protein
MIDVYIWNQSIKHRFVLELPTVPTRELQETSNTIYRQHRLHDHTLIGTVDRICVQYKCLNLNGRRMLDGRKNAIGLLVCYRNFAAYLRLCQKYITGTTVVVLFYLQ